MDRRASRAPGGVRYSCTGAVVPPPVRPAASPNSAAVAAPSPSMSGPHGVRFRSQLPPGASPIVSMSQSPAAPSCTVPGLGGDAPHLSRSHASRLRRGSHGAPDETTVKHLISSTWYDWSMQHASQWQHAAGSAVSNLASWAPGGGARTARVVSAGAASGAPAARGRVALRQAAAAAAASPTTASMTLVVRPSPVTLAAPPPTLPSGGDGPEPAPGARGRAASFVTPPPQRRSLRSLLSPRSEQRTGPSTATVGVGGGGGGGGGGGARDGSGGGAGVGIGFGGGGGGVGSGNGGGIRTGGAASCALVPGGARAGGAFGSPSLPPPAGGVSGVSPLCSCLSAKQTLPNSPLASPGAGADGGCQLAMAPCALAPSLAAAPRTTTPLSAVSASSGALACAGASGGAAEGVCDAISPASSRQTSHSRLVISRQPTGLDSQDRDAAMASRRGPAQPATGPEALDSSYGRNSLAEGSVGLADQAIGWIKGVTGRFGVQELP